MSDNLTIIALERRIQDLEFDLRLYARSNAQAEFECKKLRDKIEAFSLLYPDEYSATLEQLRKKQETFCARKRSFL